MAVLVEYDLVLMVLGLAAFGVVGLPRVLGRRPLSYPIIYVAGGAILFSLPLGLTTPDPIEHRQTTEILTEIGVITALMGTGLAINKAPGLRAWELTWRLLGITMPLTIAAVTGLGWWVLGLTPAAAILLGAVLAPTDPVLASDVQIPGPSVDDEDDDVRFALTSEAGLNDGLAFPFINLAILVAVQGTTPAAWLSEFMWVEVGYKLGVGLLAGLLVGRLLGWAIFARQSPLPHTGDGMISLAATFITYAGAEMIGGYGFLAVFVAAVVIRNQERKHAYLDQMHEFSDQIERLLSTVVLILFGGALVSGVVGYLDWRAVVVAVLIVFVGRPLAGLVGLVVSPVTGASRAAISFFGIRGVGSFFYLAYASNQVEFLQIELVWAVTALVVLISVVVHGVTATPVMAHLDRQIDRGDR
jgi:NhaP-type Na+/H+ or K+/H+ antiporter